MAFPTTSVLDNFDRTDEGPPPSANWTGAYLNNDYLAVSTNTLGNIVGSTGDAYWDTATFGPDCEVYATAVWSVARAWTLALRLTTPGSATVDGYYFAFGQIDNNVTGQFKRLDDGVSTQLGVNVSWSDAATGDKQGLEMIGSDLTLYRDTGGGWASQATRNDTTYTSAGYIGVSITASGATNLDNFGGGTYSAPSGSTYTKAGMGVIG